MLSRCGKTPTVCQDSSPRGAGSQGGGSFWTLRRILFSNVKTKVKRVFQNARGTSGDGGAPHGTAGKGDRSGLLWALGKMRSMAGRVLTSSHALGPLSCHPASLRSLPHMPHATGRPGPGLHREGEKGKHSSISRKPCGTYQPIPDRASAQAGEPGHRVLYPTRASLGARPPPPLHTHSVVGGLR